MAYRIEGEINIPLDEFWEFVAQYAPKGIGESSYGVPRVDPNNTFDLTITYVENTECNPDEEAGGPNIAQAEWMALRAQAEE